MLETPAFLCKQHVSGLVLAGGRSRRMGTHKAQLCFEGQPLISRIVHDLLPRVSHSMIASATQRFDALSDVHYIADALSNQQGPLSAIASALGQIQTPWLWVMPCDSLLLPSDLLMLITPQLQLNSDSSIICFANNGTESGGESATDLHPLMGWYHRSTYSALMDYLEQGERRVLSFVRSQRLCTIMLPKVWQSCVNSNTPDEFKAACNQYAQHRHLTL